MRHLWPARLDSIITHCLINFMVFEKNVIEYKSMFSFSLHLLSETFLILRRNELDMVKNVYWSSCKCPLFLSDFNETRIFWTDFRKTLKISYFMKKFPVGAELFHAERRADRPTEMTKLIVSFRNFANAPKKQYK
jgi:hypothetical protein